MTERQKQKHRSERYAARYQVEGEDYPEVSKKDKKKQERNILTMDQQMKRMQLEEGRKAKMRDANDKVMEETVQKILNEFSNKKTKLTLFEKREKNREQLRNEKVSLHI